MELPLQITWRNVSHSPAIEAEIRSKAAKLEQFCDHVISCRVVVNAPHRTHHKGNLFGVTLDIKVPDKEIAISQEPAQHQEHEDMYVVVRDAFDAARRQLQDYVRRRRGQVKHHAE